jgi:hypothetical protein
MDVKAHHGQTSLMLSDFRCLMLVVVPKSVQNPKRPTHGYQQWLQYVMPRWMVQAVVLFGKHLQFPAWHILGAEVDGQYTVCTALCCGKLGTSFR